jgi:hypothetical protein
VLTALLADAFSRGLKKMADACLGTSVAKLSWQVACISATRPQAEIDATSICNMATRQRNTVIGASVGGVSARRSLRAQH